MGICRACLCTLNKPSDSINILDDLYKNCNLSVLLSELFNIKIQTNDEITKEICRKCANKIVEFHKFYLMYTESDRTLRSLIETDCKPTLESHEFDSENFLPHEVVAVVKTEDCSDSFDFEEADGADDNSRESECDQPPATSSAEQNTNSWKKKIPRRLVTLWECFACHRTYRSIKTVRKHAEKCNQISETKYQGKFYKKNMNNEFVCDFCSKSFQSRQSVYAHIQKHIGQRYLCNICGKCFSSRNNLTKHNKTVHLKEKNFQCPTCEKRYDSSYRLRIHENAHKGIREFSCPLCPQSFLTTSALSRHKKTVHKQGQLYECNVCFRKFNVAYNMRAHMVTHTGIRPHICTYCKAGFQRKHKLVSHLQEVHKQFVV